jgi:catechol 2,3-dioxygenase-like lactoylglutathione lyase family enzyme
MFTGGNVTLMVSDFNRAVRFYTETLGLLLKSRAGDAWAEVQAPGLTIGLHPAGEQGPQPGQASSFSIGLEVEKLDTAMAALKEKGVEFVHTVDDKAARFAFFSDPDGTPLYLAELKAPAGL